MIQRGMVWVRASSRTLWAARSLISVVADLTVPAPLASYIVDPRSILLLPSTLAIIPALALHVLIVDCSILPISRRRLLL